MKFLKIISIFALIASLCQATPSVISYRPLQWDWDKIDVNNVTFDENFGWGAATSAFQVEGDVSANKLVQNNWTKAMQGKYPNQKLIPAHVGRGCNHWHKYKEDVKLIKNLGFTDYRFSIKWSAVMPEKDEFDLDAMNHYVDLVRELIKNGINPYVMLFHHEWPLWFDEIGAFEKEENKEYFVKFATFVFEKLQWLLQPEDFKSIKWMTFNEPVGYCLEGYFQAKYPPYKKNLKLAGIVLRNMLDAHVEIYHKFKEKNPNAQIGFAKALVPIDPYCSYNPVDVLISSSFDHLQNYAILSYFTKGEFTWGFPCYARFTAKNKDAIGALDFLAINYYSNVMLGLKFFKIIQAPVPGRHAWSGHKSIYPEGLYRAVKNVAKHLPDVPLIIGENGIATDDATLRDLYIKQHLYAVHQLIKEGHKINAYHWWSLFDSYSWKNGEFNPYGFYAVGPTYERTSREKEGFENFIHLIKHGSYKT